MGLEGPRSPRMVIYIPNSNLSGVLVPKTPILGVLGTLRGLGPFHVSSLRP